MGIKQRKFYHLVGCAAQLEVLDELHEQQDKAWESPSLCMSYNDKAFTATLLIDLYHVSDIF